MKQEEIYFDDDDKHAFKLFIQTILTILKPTEGIVIYEDGDENKKYMIWKQPYENNPSDYNLSINKLDDEQFKDAKHGDWFWIYKTKEEADDAKIDDYLIQKEIDEICGGNIRPSK